MTTIQTDVKEAIEGRARRLKSATHEVHDRLDKRIMAGEPFADRARYARFLCVQYLFHREIDALYENAALIALLPDLGARRRLPLIVQDLRDLGTDLPAASQPPAFARDYVDLATALGWLYVAEGSNLGAAFLLKAATGISLDARFGARHLAGHPDGRAQHWRSFTAALDALDLGADDETRMIAGARAAFAKVHARVEEFLG